MKKLVTLIIFNSIMQITFAQSFDQERIALSKFVERMFISSPFEGCRIIDDYDKSYLLSVVELDKSKYKSSYILNRVAQLKSQRYAGEYFNGTYSYSEITIQTPKSKEKGGHDMEETYERIRVNTSGYVKQLALLTNFETKNGMMIFVYYTKL
ncbi:MAG: hypothetical protein IJK49_08240 [Prevotella sp.]|nr:hypothetical protein [Prevotella sp.]